MEDSERIKSIVGITDLWVEECTELNEDEFDQLQLRLRAKVDNSEIWCSFNPVSKTNWTYRRWFEDGCKDEDAFILKTSYKDNLRFIPEEYVKSLEAMINTNNTYYRIYVLGEFCSLSKLVYNNWRIEKFDHKEIDGELLVGLDFGFINDNTALVASVIDGDKIYIFDEYICRGKTNNEIANAIKSLGFSKSAIIADSAEPKSIEELRREGILRIKESVKGPDSIIHGIQKLQQYELIVHPSCTETITELENYSWLKNRDGEYENKPEDKFNHCLDALRYSLQCLDKSRLKTINKSLLGL